MYKVLLADDEKIIRDGIVQFIPWEAFDCIIAFEACNGVQAKEYIGANTVDIAVLDIRMPGIGGLDLAQYILEHCPQTQVIMLTAYTDFHYIQKALRCSVVDYVIKTNFENELPNAIEKAISCISRHQKVCAPSHLVGADSVRLLTETLEGRLCDLSSIGFLSEPYCLTAFRPGIDRSSGMDRMLNAMSLACNAHAASISELIHALFVWNGCTIVLISCPGSILEKVFPVIHACYYSMLTRLDFSLGCKLAGGVSGIKTGAGKLRSACLEALHALNHTGEGIHFYADDDQAHAESYDALQEIAKHIVSGINEGEIDAAYDRLENLFSRFEAQRFPIDSVRTSCIILCSMLTAWSAKNGIFLDNELESMFYSAIRLAGTHSEIYNQLKKILDSIVGSANEHAVKYSKLVADTIQYLSKNYKEKLSLSSIANHVHISPNYLCRIFKNETGSSVMDMVNAIRIEKAKKLLGINKYKVSEVACQVGISDPGYFTHVFNKYTGVSPKDYSRK